MIWTNIRSSSTTRYVVVKTLMTELTRKYLVVKTWIGFSLYSTITITVVMSINISISVNLVLSSLSILNYYFNILFEA
jgi:hypothetical protein